MSPTIRHTIRNGGFAYPRICGYLEDLMQLSDNEKLFIERFANNEYQPDLLFEDKEIVERVAKHPMVLWKIQDA